MASALHAALLAGFNPRAHTRRDPVAPGAAKKPAAFQPTRPHEARPVRFSRLCSLPKFQPTRPHEARPQQGRHGVVARMVSTHAPTRGATGGWSYGAMSSRRFQPTRPHEARPGAALRGAAASAVSTHAPTRGATFCLWGGHAACSCFNPRAHTRRDLVDFTAREFWKEFQPTRPHEARRIDVVRPGSRRHVSTHAPTRGATEGLCRLVQAWQFQPTRPHEARPVEPHAVRCSAGVSTHAPTRGATLLLDGLCQERRVSTHAPTRGATYRLLLSPSVQRPFQPTRPHEARLPAISARRAIQRFQPTRPHEARQTGTGTVDRDSRVSTHAPTRGATRPAFADGARSRTVSTHAPTRGATDLPRVAAADRDGFNPRAHTRRDRAALKHAFG